MPLRPALQYQLFGAYPLLLPRDKPRDHKSLHGVERLSSRIAPRKDSRQLDLNFTQRLYLTIAKTPMVPSPREDAEPVTGESTPPLDPGEACQCVDDGSTVK